MNELDLFVGALARTDPAGRAAYLDEACAGKPELRRRLEELLAGEARGGRPLDRPTLVAGGAGVTFDLPTLPMAGEHRPDAPRETFDLPSADAAMEEAQPPDGATEAMATADPEATTADSDSLSPPPTNHDRGEGLGTVIAGRYTLVEVIGEGGMGSVYLASQSEPVKRQVALKLIRTGMDSRGVLARFDAERQALALMDHPNIARIYDGGVTPAGQPFFVMELVQGVPITDYCDRHRLPVKARLELFVAVCQAVQHAHQKGIIHRDLKPSNVLVTEVDGRPTPKVIDFGVAKATEVKLTDLSFADVGAIVGTPAYMSPEQADPSSMDIDTRTDVYALGVMLYELLTGAPPIDASQFHRGAVLEMLRMVREVDPPRPSTRVGTAATLPSIAAGRGIEPAQLRRALAGDLDWIVMKALEKDRSRRYDTANGLAADIVRHLASEPVLAAPPSRAYRIRKFVRKNRGGVIAAGLVLFALVVGIVGTTLGLIQAARANRALAAKNVELAEEEAKVERRFELAQKAIGTFHTGVTEDMLMKNDQFRELRTKLLREAAGFYGDLERLLEGQTDARSRTLLGSGYAQLGDLTAKIGEPEKALAVHRKALEVRRSLAAKPGVSREARLDVARTLSDIGELLLKTGDSERALRAHEEQGDIARRLGAEAATADVEEVLARSYSAIGNTLERTDRLPQAREAWRKGSDLWRKLADGNPTEPRFRLELAKSYGVLGVQLRMQGDELEEAMAVQEKGLAIHEKLVGDHPTVAEYQYELALAYDLISWAKSEVLWRPKEAMAAHENALSLFSKLAEAYPAVNDYQSKLAQDYESFASLLEYSGKWAEALAVHRKGLAVSRKLVEGNPGDLDARWKNGEIYQDAGRVLQELGREAEALDVLRDGLASFQKVASVDPSFEDSGRYVCWTQNDIGVLLERAGKPTEALKAYADARTAGNKYVELHPNDSLIQRQFAWTHAFIGRLHRDEGRLPEALDAAQAAVRIRRKLSAGGDPIEVRNLPGAMILEASILLRLGRTAEARTILDEAIPLLIEVVKKYPDRPLFIGNLAHGYLRLGQARQAAGDAAGAVADWKRAIEIDSSIAAVRSGPQTFEYACARAALSGAATDPAEADRAMALLKKATGMTFRNPATFRTEPALDPLRNRDDFKALMKDLEERAGKPLAGAPPREINPDRRRRLLELGRGPRAFQNDSSLFAVDHETDHLAEPALNEYDLFVEALARTDPAERAAFLDEACAGNPGLRRRLEDLLAGEARGGNPLDRPTLEAGGAGVTFDLPTVPITGVHRPDGPGETIDQSHTDARTVGGPPPHGATVTMAPADHETTTAASGSPSPPVTKGQKGEGIGTIIAGRYTLVEVIGEGGMGSVYLASQSEPVKRQVALKLIRTGMDSRGVLARFDAERQALALMDHPNIARIYDGGVTPAGQPFFVMELVQGVPLTDYCDRKRLPVKARLNLFVAVCQAVQHAHQKGIIHRDLKPGNVLVTEVDGRATPKVIDFGVAKATGQNLTEMSLADTGAIVGTPTYMSPEQADPSSMDIDTRTDVYALGVMLYELLTGSPPLDARHFKRGAVLEMLRMVREVDPPRPSTKLSTADALPNIAANRDIEPARLSKLLQGELDWVVMKALEKDRTRRYETANGFARDIQRYLADELVEARPPSAGYRLKKFVRRHKASAIAATAVAASLCIGLVAFAWQAKVARDQRDLAVKAEKAEAEQRKVADTARDAEAAARKQTELALTESQRKTARMTYENAQALCEGGQADVGLLWMARSLELTPPGAEDLDYAIRTSINLWGQQLNTVRRQWLNQLGGDWNGSTWGPGAGDIALSPDGLSVLLVNLDGIARVFEQATPKVRYVLALEAGAPAAGNFLDGARYSPDGRFVAIARSDQRARVWSAVTGQLVGKPLVHEEPLTGVGFDPTGKFLVTTAGTKIHFWNVETGVEEGGPITAEHGLSGVEVGADGRHMMTWTRSPGGVTIWDFKSRRRLHLLQGVDFEVYHAGFSPDVRVVLASGSSKADSFPEPMSAQFWETATGRPLGMRMNWQSTMSVGESSNRPCFRPDGRLIVTGGTPLRMWQAPSGKPLGAVASMLGVQRPVFLPDGKVLMAFFSNSIGIDKQLIDVAPALEPVAIGAGFGDGYGSSLDFAPDGRTVIRSYYHPEKSRKFCRLYELPTGRAVGEVIETEGLPSFSPDWRSVAAVVGTNACLILDTATGRERIPRIVMDSRMSALALSPDGHLLASGDGQGAVRLWNTATGISVGPPMLHQQPINRICFSPDGRKLLVAGGNLQKIFGEARLWDVATGQPLGPALEITGAVRIAVFSPDGKTFATGSLQLILWDVATSRKIWTAPSSSTTSQVAFTSDGRKVLASYFEENAARLYDARSGDPVTPLLRHKREVRSTAVSPDGRFVITCSEDKTTRLWDTSLGLPLGPAWSNSIGSDVSFNPDGRSVLMIGDTNGLVRWEIPPPVEGTPERIRLAIETATRLSLDPFGGIQFLSPSLQIDPVAKRPRLSSDPFEPVGKRLQELGGPPGAFRR